MLVVRGNLAHPPAGRGARALWALALLAAGVAGFALIAVAYHEVVLIERLERLGSYGLGFSGAVDAEIRGSPAAPYQRWPVGWLPHPWARGWDIALASAATAGLAVMTLIQWWALRRRRRGAPAASRLAEFAVSTAWIPGVAGFALIASFVAPWWHMAAVRADLLAASKLAKLAYVAHVNWSAIRHASSLCLMAVLVGPPLLAAGAILRGRLRDAAAGRGVTSRRQTFRARTLAALAVVWQIGGAIPFLYAVRSFLDLPGSAEARDAGGWAGLESAHFVRTGGPLELATWALVVLSLGLFAYLARGVLRSRRRGAASAIAAAFLAVGAVAVAVPLLDHAVSLRTERALSLPCAAIGGLGACPDGGRSDEPRGP